MSKKRQTFKCWNCHRKYSLLKELSEKRKLFIACPFCMQDAIVNLTPYEKPTINTYKSGDHTGESEAVELELPEVLLTEKPPGEDLEA